VAAGSGRDRTVQPGMTRMFVTAGPGLGSMISRKLGRLPGRTLLALMFGWVTPAAWSWPTSVSRRVCPI
jgi:hypothetical protein